MVFFKKKNGHVIGRNLRVYVYKNLMFQLISLGEILQVHIWG